MPLRAETTEEIANAVVRRGAKGGIDIEEESIALLPTELFTQELYNRLEAIECGYAKVIVLHDRRISDRFEAYDDLCIVFLLVRLQRRDGCRRIRRFSRC